MGGILEMSNLEETPGNTQDTPERLCLLSGMGRPHSPPRRVEVARESRGCCPRGPDIDKQRKTNSSSSKLRETTDKAGIISLSIKNGVHSVNLAKSFWPAFYLPHFRVTG